MLRDSSKKIMLRKTPLKSCSPIKLGDFKSQQPILFSLKARKYQLKKLPLGCTFLFRVLTKSKQFQKSYEFHTSYLTDSYIVFTLKMESVSKIKIFGLKIMLKGGPEKILLKFLYAEAILF